MTRHFFRAVIFDLDGVIIDSEPFHWNVNKKLFAALGFAVSPAEYSEFIGVSNTRMWTVLKRRYSLSPEVPQLVRGQVDGNLAFLKKHAMTPMPGLAGLLRSLSSRGLKTAIASSSPREYIDLAVKKIGMVNDFPIRVSGEDFLNGKPHPDIFLKTAELLGEPPARCLVIEDAMHGVAAAKAAGMACVGLAGGQSGNQDLSRADAIVAGLADIDDDFLDGLNSGRTPEEPG